MTQAARKRKKTTQASILEEESNVIAESLAQKVALEGELEAHFEEYEASRMPGS